MGLMDKEPRPIELNCGGVTVLVHLHEDPPRIHFLTENNDPGTVAIFVDGVQVAGPLSQEDREMQARLDANPELKAQILESWHSKDRVQRPPIGHHRRRAAEQAGIEIPEDTSGPRPVLSDEGLGKINGRE
jgi:hypothetical protein